MKSHMCMNFKLCLICMHSKVNIRVNYQGNKAICDGIIVKFTFLAIDFHPQEFQELCLLLNV